MLSFMGSLRVFLCVEACDMRKGFEGLHALVGEDVRGGALFVFTNKRHTRLKVLCFDGTGLWLMTKRLEVGTFAWSKLEEIGAAKLALRPEAFAMLSDGSICAGRKCGRGMDASK